MKWSLNLACISALGAWACGGGTATGPGTPIENVPGAAAGTVAPPPTGATPTTSGSPSPTGTPSQPTAAAGSGSAKPPATAAAGSSAMNPPSTTPPKSNEPDPCPSCGIPLECRGFSFADIKYSPGGTDLPNKCKPYDATLNNPYAVRCIDALPNFKTPFVGDEFCILPPPPDKGFQVGLHPQGKSADYWKAIWAHDLSGYEKAPTEWVLKAGDEITQNYRSRDAPLPTESNYYRTYFRMRTGSHHMIVTMHDGMEKDGWIPGATDALPGLFDTSSGAVQGILGGEQRPDDNTPVTLEKPAEDDGLYLTFPKDPSIIFNMHHFNVTDKPLLREGWINIWLEPDARKKVSWYMGLEIGQVISLNVAPQGMADLHYSWPVNSEMRLIRVFGHRHFWTTNFSTWVTRADGKTEILYQSYDWFDMPTYRYDSVVKNPPLDPMKQLDGAVSGIVMLKPGDKLHFNCHIEFTDKRKATDAKAPSPSEVGRLRFANEAYNGEMCIQFGNVTGGALGLPGVDSSPVPDFAKVTRMPSATPPAQ
ncbi:MAG TPA: hypothetical protein VJV78_06170 [Polyangiales bacterium]|nr:hypothetical protein [Polyangiales bacterium]